MMPTSPTHGPSSLPERPVADADALDRRVTPSEKSGPVLSLPVLPLLGEAAGFTLARLLAADTVAIGLLRLSGMPAVAAWAVLAVVTIWSLVPGAHLASAAAGALVTWLLGTGFVSNRLGDLSFTVQDREHLLVLALAAVVALTVNRRARTVARAAGRA
jgi:hypothetical protein